VTSEPIRDPKKDALLTPDNCALLVIDYQPSQFATVNSMDRDLLTRNIVSVARIAKTYGIPIVLSTVNVVANGQTVALTGSGTDLGILGASQNGTATGTITVNYTDGSSQSFTLNMADWYANAPAAGSQILTTTSSWNQSTPTGAHPVSVYFASVPLEPGKTVASVTLPSLPGSFGGTEMHVFAVAAGSGTPTS